MFLSTSERNPFHNVTPVCHIGLPSLLADVMVTGERSGDAGAGS
jgi:hypothetical protein